MVERRSELDRRYQRKKKLRKLKHKLAMTADAREKEKILKRIHSISPLWNEGKPQAPRPQTAPAPKSAPSQTRPQGQRK